MIPHQTSQQFLVQLHEAISLHKVRDPSVGVHPPVLVLWLGSTVAAWSPPAWVAVRGFNSPPVPSLWSPACLLHSQPVQSLWRVWLCMRRAGRAAALPRRVWPDWRFLRRVRVLA